MSYYAVLSAASALLSHQHYTTRRCMRRFNGPHRYVLFDARNQAVCIDNGSKNRRMGYTLRELLVWLTRQTDTTVANQARVLLQQLDESQQLKSAI